MRFDLMQALLEEKKTSKKINEKNFYRINAALGLFHMLNNKLHQNAIYASNIMRFGFDVRSRIDKSFSIEAVFDCQNHRNRRSD